MTMIKDKGFVSLLILLTLSALLWTGTVVFTKISSQERIIAYEGQKTQARFLADSGLEWAKDNLKADSSWEGGSISLVTGEIRVDVRSIPQGFSVTSRAESGRARHGVYGELVEDDNSNLILSKYEELFN
ncbi:MAG: hypothetical protein APF84_10295 [Gracilibacter sp. BRH_c7a]|nr:MAG: hypothetical protein APF84_10295 [Gracilibacter sp. BRH_c7a]